MLAATLAQFEGNCEAARAALDRDRAGASAPPGWTWPASSYAARLLREIGNAPDQAVKDLRADRGHGRRRRLGAGRAPRPLVDLDLSGERSVPRQQRAAGPLAPPRRRGVGRDHAWSTRLPVEGGVSAGYGAGNARRATRHSRGGALETWPRATAQRWRRSQAFTMLPRGAGSCGLERAICPHSADTAAIAYPAKPL